METTAIEVRQPLTIAQIDLIKKTVAVGATDNELRLFLYQAEKRGLDPLTRQIHFIKRKRKNPAGQWEEIGTIQTGIDGFRLIADRTKKLSGIKRGVDRNDKGELISAWAEVYRTDWKEPAREEVSFNEYCQKDGDGKPQALWRTMPETMLKKVAEAAALRMAFPEDLSGLYSDDEMNQADTTTKEQIKVTPEYLNECMKNGEPIIAPAPEPKPDMATPEQLKRIRELREKFNIAAIITDLGITARLPKELTSKEAEQIIAHCNGGK